ncbi:hypothetical protein D3C87_2043170 [compost metagenome]
MLGAAASHGLQARTITVRLLNFIDQPGFMGASSYRGSAAAPAESDAAEHIHANGLRYGRSRKNRELM